MIKLFVQNVEIQCKTLYKSLRNCCEKICAFLLHTTLSCVKSHFSTHFSKIIHPFLHSSTTPISNQSFPLFHQAYNYYYLYILININNRKD